MDTALNDKFDQILRFDLNHEKFENDYQIVPYLRLVTGCRYGVETSAHRRWGDETSIQEEGKFYQIIPDRVDDGFFDWYCDYRPFHQFFRTVEMALLHFVFYWHVWMDEKKAKV